MLALSWKINDPIVAFSNIEIDQVCALAHKLWEENGRRGDEPRIDIIDHHTLVLRLPVTVCERRLAKMLKEHHPNLRMRCLV